MSATQQLQLLRERLTTLAEQHPDWADELRKAMTMIQRTPMEISGHGIIPGLSVARDVVLAGDLAYVASDRFGISVVRVHVASATLEVVGVASAPMDGTKIAVGNGLAFLIGSRSVHDPNGAPVLESGLWIFDLSNPISPELVGRYPGAFTGVAVRGKVVYLSAGAGGLHKVDVSDPPHPSAIVYDSPGWANQPALSGDGRLVLLADGTAGLAILDADGLVFRSRLDTPGNALGVAVVGDLAYVADGTSLQIIDIADPGAPSLVGSIPVGARRVQVRGDVAYCISHVTTLVDVSDPGAPKKGVAIPPHGHPQASTLAIEFIPEGGFLAANSVGGLTLIASGTAPTISHSEWFHGYKLALNDSGVAIVSGRSYREGGWQSVGGIRAIGFEDGKPRISSSMDNASWQTFDVSIGENRALLGAGFDGLQIVLANAMTLLGSYDSPGLGWTYAGAILGKYAFVADNIAGVHVVDISNPASPTQITTIPSPSGSRHLVISGNFLYVACNRAFMIVDISNPIDPQVKVEHPMSCLEVRVEGPLAFVAGGTNGMTIFDVSNPSAPAKLGTVPRRGHRSANNVGVWVSGTRAYMANGMGGLAIVNVSNPSAPAVIGSVPAVENCFSVVVRDKWAYCADTVGTISTILLE